MDNQPTQAPELNTARLPFDVEFYKLSETFCADSLKQIPELAGIAIVPIWANQPENTPSGLLKLRNHQPPYLAGLLALLGRITAFASDVHRDFIAQLKMFDQYAAELANQIKERVDELQTLDQRRNDDAAKS
jgi:hypothetical protein